MNDKAVSAIILCLGDKVLREVARERSAVRMWTKLDSLYMTKSLAHR
ncbi:ubiquitin-protein ligase, partial [Trifolium medium]|nr:ubiquitin-protein ligase [Trifolium medium]